MSFDRFVMKLKLFPGAQEDNDSAKYRFDRIKSHLYRTGTPGAPFFSNDKFKDFKL